jgi:hypothetical protein
VPVQQTNQSPTPVREDQAMKQYRVLFGAYVRMYAEHNVEAENDETARRLAIEEFKLRSGEFQWFDADYDNLAFPSICSMQSVDPPGDVLEGYDVPLTPKDTLQYAADKMLEALEFVSMTFADIEASKRKGYYADCPKVVAEAIAQATAVQE